MLAQRDNAEAVTGSSLLARIAGIPKNLAVGYSFPAEALGSALAAVLLVVGVALLVRLAPAERRGALVAGSLAVVVIVTPVVLAVAGEDYVIARNTIVAVVPAPRSDCMSSRPPCASISWRASGRPSPPRRASGLPSAPMR